MKKPDQETKAPADLLKALTASPSAMALWKGLTPISRRDFVSWIVSAKQAETRARRVRVALSKLESGQRRPCCYAVVPMDLYGALSKNPKAKAEWKTLSPDEKRDYNDWINSAGDSKATKSRAEKACVMLAAGKRK